jgi:hypothetical protein
VYECVLYILAWYLRLGGGDIGSTCDDEAGIPVLREIMSGGCDRQRVTGRKVVVT